MQTSPSWLPRPCLHRHAILFLVSRSKCVQRAYIRNYTPLRSPRYLPTDRRSVHHSRPNAERNDYTSEPVPFVKQQIRGNLAEESLETGSPSRIRRVQNIPGNHVRDVEAWIDLLDTYLPRELRTSTSDNRYTQHGDESEEEACKDIVAVLESARTEQHAGVEILTHMVIHGRKDAALHIVTRLLRDIATRFPSRELNLMPSNIQWPGFRTNRMCRSPINLTNSNVQRSTISQQQHERAEDPRYSFILSEKREATMTEIWSMLGSLIIATVDLPAAQASEVTNTVLLILGQIHNLDLVPEKVYSYSPSSSTITVQRPPILHLVSSRIFTALSDATWRQQQDEMIEKAAKHGIPYSTIGRDPPGGRFRLKVRPLGPEIWLEFILWCCVEGGFNSAGARIIRRLGAQSENPWFAVTWSLASGVGQPSPLVDWQRIREQNRRSVGFKEGHSDEKPFVEMPTRTISTEVVLGLVESSLNSINNVLARAHTVQAVQRNIFDLIAFLEPHDLPVSYFNYLAVRFMQAEIIDFPEDSHSLQTWYKRLIAMKALQTAQHRRDPEPALQLDAIAAHSEVFAGIFHQALDGCVQIGNVHRALDIFNHLQESVDSSKLQAIGSFLDETAAKKEPTLLASAPPPLGDLLEFVRSHAQLPLYKLTGVLDLATNTGLTGFGQWLLYSDGPDGPLIPKTAYQYPGLGQALLRFAVASKDPSMLKAILNPRKSSKRKFTVSFLREIINANIALLQFQQAESHLITLSESQGGGLGLSNVAQLSATIFRVESSNSYDLTGVGGTDCLRRANSLLEQMLSGRYNNRTGAYQTVVRTRYRHQIAALLQIFQLYPGSALAAIATRFSSHYPRARTAVLEPTIFNYFMEAVVQSKGSIEGMRLWNLCCQASDKTQPLFYDAALETDSQEEYDMETWDDPSENRDDQRAGVGLQDEEVASDASTQTSFTSFTASQDKEDDLIPRSFNNSSRPPSASHDNEDNMDTASFSNSFFPSTSTDALSVSGTTQLVEPNQQTLRLIIRAAVRERQERLKSKSDITTQKEVLAWAAEVLETLGATRRMISIEIEEPVKQSQIRKLNNQQYTTRHQPATPQVVRRIQSTTPE